MTEMSTHHPDLSEAIEPEGVNAESILKMVVGTFILVLVILFSTMVVAEVTFQEAKRDITQFTGYPLLRETRTAGQSKLEGYAPVDREAGIYRIPIDRAMELIVEESRAVTQ